MVALFPLPSISGGSHPDPFSPMVPPSHGALLNGAEGLLQERRRIGYLHFIPVRALSNDAHYRRTYLKATSTARELVWGVITASFFQPQTRGRYRERTAEMWRTAATGHPPAAQAVCSLTARPVVKMQNSTAHGNDLRRY